MLCVHDRADTSLFVDDPSWEPGKGTCKSEGVSINRGEPLVACEDHLDPPCEDVVNVSIPPTCDVDPRLINAFATLLSLA